MGATERLLSRRRVMRGLMNGGAVTVALPFLDCFLDVNGTAMADGTPRRVRFAHWFFGNGFTAGQQWSPDANRLAEGRQAAERNRAAGSGQGQDQHPLAPERRRRMAARTARTPRAGRARGRARCRSAPASRRPASIR